MAMRAAHGTYTLEEYVILEDFANVRHEFADGQVYAMSGGSPQHAIYTANVIGLLRAQLTGGPCRVLSSDGRIRVQSRNLNTYPDASVVCGPIEVDSLDRHAILNPCMIVEVLSPNTEVYNRGEKLASYQEIPSLREVVFVAHDARRIEVIRRGDDGEWTRASAGPGETLALTHGCSLAVDDVYFDVAPGGA